MRKGLCLSVLAALVLGFALVLVPAPAHAMTGSGTEGDPYIIYDVDDLQDMENDLDAYYELANDIDASATTTWNWDAGRGVYEGFVPVGNFNGHFDGNFYTISNLYINRDYASTAHVGLFRQGTGSTDISNLRILDANITVYQSSGYSNHVGVFVEVIYLVKIVRPNDQEVPLRATAHYKFHQLPITPVRHCSHVSYQRTCRSKLVSW